MIHGDVSPRHILFHNDRDCDPSRDRSRLTIIDFDQARVAVGGGINRGRDKERREVEAMLMNPRGWE